jgi:hypothetical protein
MILDEIYDDDQLKKMLKIAAQDVIKARGYGDIESYLKSLAERDFDEFGDIVIYEDMPATTVAGILQQAFDKAGEMCNWDSEDDTVWGKLYDKIFSEDVARKVWKMFPYFDYYDPDTSYYEDLQAFVSSFVDWAKEEK